MRTENVNIYEYDELSVEAKEVARKWYTDSMNEDFSFESEQITESFTDELSELGYTDVEVNWSLSHCQGDGVAFYGTLYTQELLKIAKRLLSERDYNRLEVIGECEDVSVEINRSGWGNYHHWNTMSVELVDAHCWEDYPKVLELLEKLVEEIEKDVVTISKRLEEQGYAEIDYRFSKEAIEESIRVNAYEFTEDGNRY